MTAKILQNKWLNFVIKHKFEFSLGLCSLLVFLSGIWSPFVYFACTVVSITYLFSKPDEVLCGLLYFVFFSVARVFFMFNLCAGLASLIINYIIQVKRKENKVYLFPLILTTAMLAFYSIIHYEVGFSGFEQGSLIIAIFYASYLFFCLHKSMDFQKAIDYMALGLLASTILGAIALLIPTYKYFIYFIDEYFSRLQLFSAHTNHLSMNCLFLIAFEIYNLINRKSRFLKCALVIIFAMVVGFMTMSKAFIVILVGFVAYLSIWLIKKYKLKSFRVIIPILIVFVVACFVFKDFMKNIIERFFVYNSDKSIINKFTTGRSQIWFTYMDMIRSSVPKMLFGVGLFTNELIPIGSHNIYLYILSRFGFIGIVLIAVLIYSYIKNSSGGLKIKYDNMLPFLTYLILGIEEMIFSERFFIFFIVSVVFMVDAKSANETDESYTAFDNLINKNIKFNEFAKKLTKVSPTIQKSSSKTSKNKAD